MKLFIKALAVFLVLSCLSCELTGDNENNDPGNNDNNNQQTGSTNISVNLDGASALFTQSTSPSRGGLSRSVDQSPLVKLKEDGTIEEVLKIEYNTENVYFPNIRFIATGLDGSVYVCFDHPFHVPEEDGPGKEIVFIHLTKDNKMTIIENYAHVQDFSFNWGAGAGQDPVIFDDNGAMYYTVWNNNDLKLKKYYNGVSESINSSGNINIEAFFTDGKYVFFLGQNNQQDNKAYFLRMVDPDNKNYVDLFYSSGNDHNGTWIRDVKLIKSGEDKDILLHGYNIPYRYKKLDDKGDIIFTNTGEEYHETKYEGLMKLDIHNFGDSPEDYEFIPLLGMARDQDFFNDQDQYSRVLSKTIFFDDNGDLNQELVNYVLKIFFIDGIVPDGIDPFKEVVIDRNDQLFTDFNFREDIYFWYKLLEGSTGLDLDYFEKFKNTSQWYSIFPYDGDVGRYIFQLMFNEQHGQKYLIQEGSDLLDSEGLIKLGAFKDAISKSEELNNIFNSIELKSTLEDGTEITGALIPTEIFGDYSNFGKFKEYLDTYFNYEIGSKKIDWFDSWAFFDSQGTNIIQAKVKYRTNSDTDNDTFKADILLSLNSGSIDPSSFVFKPNSDGKTLTINSDFLTEDEMYNEIEWEWEENDSEKVYDKTGVLGKYRVVNSNWDSRNFIYNFFNYTPSTDGIQVDSHIFWNLLEENSGTYRVNSFYNGDTGLDSDAFLNKVLETTNIQEVTYKSDSGNILLTVGANSASSIPSDLYSRKIVWDFESGYTASEKVSSWTNSVTGETYDYMYDSSDTNWDSTFWVYNFFNITEGPKDIGYIDIHNMFEDGIYKERYVAKSELKNIDDFITSVQVNTQYGNNSSNPILEAKVLVDPNDSNNTISFDPAFMNISNNEMYKEIAWQWEENSFDYTYDEVGTLGNYRVVNPLAQDDQRWFLYNFFNVTTETYDLTDLTDNDDFWNVLNAFSNAIYKESDHGGVYKYNNSYLNENGSLNSEKVLAVVSKFADNPGILTAGKKVFSAGDYQVQDPETGNYDWEGSMSNFANTIFGLTGLPEYPISIKTDNFWSYTTDPYNSFDSADDVLEFWNLDQFTLSDTNEVYGLFRQNWDSNVYNIAKLMDEEGNPVQEMILRDIQASSIKVVDKTLFYLQTSFNGKQSLNRLDIESDAQVIEIVKQADNFEIYKYDVADDLSGIYFTAQQSEGSKLVIGDVDLTTNTYTTEESVGINSNSDIEIYSAN